MKGSDVIKITIDIGGELITLDVDFDDQNDVRDVEKALKRHIERLKKAWPDNSDRRILAMTAFQLARSYYQLVKIQDQVIETANLKLKQIEEHLSVKSESDFLSDLEGFS